MTDSLRWTRRSLGGPLRRYWAITTSLMGVVLGVYVWQFLRTNQDFTGPQPVTLRTGLALTFLVGPMVLWVMQSLSAAILALVSGQPWRACLRQDAWSALPLGLLGLSPLLGLLTGRHPTAYHAGVIVPVSLAFGGYLALKAGSAWHLCRQDHGRLALDARWARYVVFGIIALYAAIFVTLVVLRYNAFQLWGVDHTMVAQALWNTGQERFLRFNFVNGEDMSLLAEQFVPIYILFAPLYWLIPDPRLLFVVQAVAIASGAWPVYHMALRRLQSPSLALLWAATYLVLPMTLFAAQDSMGAIRPETLAIPIFLFMLDALDRRNWLVFGAMVLLAFAAKQWLSPLVAALGLWVAYRLDRRLLGWGLCIAGILWFVGLTQWVMPAIRGGPNLTLIKHIGQAAGEQGVAGVAQMLVSNPGLFLGRVLAPGHLLLLFFILFSLGGLPLADLWMAGVTLPVLAMLAISTHSPVVWLGDYHYFPILPFLILAAIGGVVTFGRRLEQWLNWKPQRGVSTLTGFALGMALAGACFWSYSPLGWRFWDPRSQGVYWADTYRVGLHAKVADQFLSRIPDQIPVLASEYLAPRLANRAELYSFYWPPDDVLDRVGYVVIDLLQNHVRTERTMAAEIALMGDLMRRPDFALTAFEDGVLLFQRSASQGYISQVDILPLNPQPQIMRVENLGGRLKLLGYDPPAGPLRAGERARVTYYWQVLDGYASAFAVKLGVNPESIETHQTNYVLADHFASAVDEFDVLHLPTYLQMPPGRWQPGQIIRETYDFYVPDDAQGEYQWQVGLYAVPRFLGIRIEIRRQVPGTEPALLGTLRVEPAK